MANTTTDYKDYQIEQKTPNRVSIYKDGKYINSSTDLGSAQRMIDLGVFGNKSELQLRVEDLIKTYKKQLSILEGSTWPKALQFETSINIKGLKNTIEALEALLNP